MMNTPLHEITIPLSSVRVAESIMHNAKMGFSSRLNSAKSYYDIGLRAAAASCINQAGEYRRIYAAAKSARELLRGVS
ncbi:hypothetical protein AHAT_19150 [Agarivorans sp. Toyoura001]|uniref:hypothetical protein n=1 Tax=Agarivorans sp. Toyoura001 TaxID=2283141 RepID=UPI0010F25E4B|nr:hypothetical protein [Agarivorans sp. Toyoura001]GDY26025.1 hypothetical protein AHAT_19150 [Agarivorans sp. Toyoura001]